MRTPKLLVTLAALVVCCSSAAGQCLEWGGDFAAATNGLSAPVRALEVFDDGAGAALYAGGHFLQAGSQFVDYIARWDGVAWSPVGAGADGPIYALRVFDDGSGPALYAGGRFTHIGGVNTKGIAKWDGTSWSAVDGGLAAVEPALPEVRALTVHNDGAGPALFVGGRFTVAGEVDAACIARWDGEGWSALGEGVGGTQFEPLVRAMAPFDLGSGLQLIVAGEFQLAGGIEFDNVAAWNGVEWSDVGGGLGGPANSAHSLASFSVGGVTRLYACGEFPQANLGAVLRLDGPAWTQIVEANDPITCLFVHSDANGPALYAGGSFSTLGGDPMNHIAKWAGGAWAPLSTGISGGFLDQGPLAMESFNDGGGLALFVGGEFTHAGANDSENLAKWGVECAGPQITLQPADLTAAINVAVEFEVAANGAAPLSYQWRLNGNPLTDNVSIHGSQTPQLEIAYWSLNDAGVYDVVITNPIGTTVSSPATLTVPTPGGSGLPVVVSKVIYPPEPTPTGGGETFTDVFGPVMMQDGSVLFGAYIDGNSMPLSGFPCIAVWRNGQVQIIARHNQPAPGTEPGVVFKNPSGGAIFSAYNAGSNGDVVFAAEIDGPNVIANTNNTGIWHWDGETVRLVARNGSQAAGVALGAVFSRLSINNVRGRPIVGDSGRVAFTGRLTGSGHNPSTSLGVWAWDVATGQALLARTNVTAPGSTATFSRFNESLWLDDMGRILVFGGLNRVTFPGFSDSGFWLGSPGGLALLARTGTAVADPAFAQGSVIHSVGEGEMLINGPGAATYNAIVREPAGAEIPAMFQQEGSATTLALRRGTQSPGGAIGSTFDSFRPHAMNDEGAIALTAFLATPPCNPPCPNNGVFLHRAGSITPVALNHSGDPPGGPPGSLFPALFDVQTALAVNNSERVVMGARLQAFGGVRGAVYGWTQAHGLFPLVIPGMQLEVAPGVYGTVVEAFVSTRTGGASATASGLNDAGSVVLQVNFLNGRRGIFSAQFDAAAAAYLPCVIIESQPADRTVNSGQPATFSVVATASGVVTYQWRRNASNVSNGGAYSGVNGPTLTIQPAAAALAGEYDVVITNPCGAETSEAATLTVNAPCPGDANGDLLVNFADLNLVLSNFGQTGAGIPGDVTGDGVVNFSDLNLVLSFFGTAC